MTALLPQDPEPHSFCGQCLLKLQRVVLQKACYQTSTTFLGCLHKGKPRFIFFLSRSSADTVFTGISSKGTNNGANVVQFSQYSFCCSPQLPKTPFALKRKQQHRTVCTQTGLCSIRWAKAKL